MILYRPTGLAELHLVRDSDWSEWPPRLPDQPIFYPVTTFAYAEKIARDWNAVGQGEAAWGFVTRFEITDDRAARHPVELAGGRDHAELWVPAEELPAFNADIVGTIEAIAAYRDRKAFDLAKALKATGLDD